MGPVNEPETHGPLLNPHSTKLKNSLQEIKRAQEQFAEHTIIHLKINMVTQRHEKPTPHLHEHTQPLDKKPQRHKHVQEQHNVITLNKLSKNHIHIKQHGTNATHSPLRGQRHLDKKNLVAHTQHQKQAIHDQH